MSPRRKTPGPLVYRSAKPAYLTPQAFGEIFAISAMSVYRRIEAGEVRANRIGRFFRIPVAEVARYAKATEVDPFSEESA